MSDFWEVQIQDVAEVLVSNVDKKSYAGQKAVVLCNYMNVYSNDYISSALNFMESTASEAEIKKFSLRKGDVVITKDSESPFDIGIPSVVIEDIDNLVCGYHLAIIRPNLNKVDPLFLAKQLSSEKSTRYFARVAAGSTRFGLSVGAIHALPLQVTSLEVQKKIGEIGLAIDNQIEVTQALIDKYTAIKQGMMADLFGRGIDPETKALRPTFEEAPELYHKTPLGMLPKGWDVKTLREYTTLLEQGWSPDCESEPAFEGEWGVLKTSAVVWEGYLPGENKRLPRKLKPKDKYEVYPGDVLITRAGPGSRVGVVAFVNTTPKRLMLSDKLYRLRFDSRLDGMFASYLLSCELVQSQLNKVKTGLAESQANISQEIVMSLRIAVPNADEQKAITDKVRSAENYLNLEREHLDKLLAQKAGLMQDLLTGKVPVPA